MLSFRTTWKTSERPSVREQTLHRAHLGCRRKYISWDFPFSPSAFVQRFRKTTQKTPVRAADGSVCRVLA